MEEFTICHCGKNYLLPELDDEELENTYDLVINHGSDLVERAANWTAAEFVARKASYERALSQQVYNLEVFDREFNRRKRAVAAGDMGQGRAA
jgi:hypothetical protein